MQETPEVILLLSGPWCAEIRGCGSKPKQLKIRGQINFQFSKVESSNLGAQNLVSRP